MNPCRLFVGGTLFLMLAGGLPGQESGGADSPPKTMRLHLIEKSMEDTIVTGQLSIDTLIIDTEFGRLEIPVESIISMTPGLDSHPQERARIARFIQQLGAGVAKQRDEAQRALLDMGLAIREQLEAHSEDDDTERRSRIAKILAELEELADEEAFDEGATAKLIAQDTIETTLFTVVGSISPKSFEVKTRFGILTVALKDIRRVERETDVKPEIRRSLSVAGTNLIQFTLKNSGIRLNRGDQVSVTADGKITMSPWGSNVVSTPEGGANFQWYEQNKIPGGALVARIGATGKVFKVGTKLNFVADRAGVLYFAVAMAHQFANQSYQFPGQYNVKVRVKPKSN